MRSLLLAALLGLGAPALAAAPAAPALSAQQQARVEKLQDTLRCPICTGESISESSNDISREMRAEVARLVAQGESDRQIYDHFASRYGQFVLLDPPKQGANLVLWAGPLLALGAGAWWLLSTLKGRAGTAPATITAQDSPAAEDPDLQPYLEQVQRDLAQPAPHHTQDRSGPT
ncbi:cytochrome c-type biogenesis protein CcmH [Deinococcus sp. Marseille-Q6407]|uniref:cytochrome c-type biogenesis protein n=1 Tax=Deinococcus sp. Marseille-Q6407 TaxID=2969223 RepID=UPI0021BF0CF3|nr:cytochrome c-type biogenesis protein [Deinococcus sp. Marseille-Q6407]